MVSVILCRSLLGNQLWIHLDELLRQFRIYGNVQLSAHHHCIGNGLCARVVVKEDVSPLDILVFQDRFESDNVWLELFRFIEVIVSLIAVFMTPPFIKFASVKAEVEHARARNLDILANGILEFGFVDEGWNSADGSHFLENIGP